MKLDPGSTPEAPQVGRESAKAIFPVAIEVVCGTVLLGWAMLSLPSVLAQTLHITGHGELVAALGKRSEDMLRFIWYDRALFAATFVVLFGVELTLAKTKPDALFFVLCVLGLGLGLRAYTQKRGG